MWWSHVSLSKELPTVGKCHKFTTMFSPAVFWHGNTDWILVNLCPPPPWLHVQPNAFLFCCKELWAFCYQSSCCCSFVLFPPCESAKAALGFILMERYAFLCSNCVQLLLSFFCFVPMLFQLFASLHTRCSHCLLFALRISHQPCLPPSSMWTFFFPSCFSCIDFVQFDFSKVLTKIGSGRQESTNSESAHKDKVGEGERISGDSEIDEVTPRWKRKIVSEVKRCIEVVLCCTCVWKEFDVNLFSLGPCVINLPFYTFILNISLKCVCVCVRSVCEWERKTSTYLQV